MKKLNSRGMTLVEVLSAVVILSVMSLVVFNSAMLILGMFDRGKFVYVKTVDASNLVEYEQSGSSAGAVTFSVNGNPVTITGTYYSQTETKGTDSLTLTLFSPN